MPVALAPSLQLKPQLKSLQLKPLPTIKSLPYKQVLKTMHVSREPRILILEMDFIHPKNLQSILHL
jgi:hypothetical protein